MLPKNDCADGMLTALPRFLMSVGKYADPYFSVGLSLQEKGHPSLVSLTCGIRLHYDLLHST